jgi:N-acyl-L-homoserine lactone synthetase
VFSSEFGAIVGILPLFFLNRTTLQLKGVVLSAIFGQIVSKMPGDSMFNLRFDFCSLHRHGSAFWDFLRLRKVVFVDQLHWDIPHNDAIEMDQYDTPVAHYSLVMKDGIVVGGARAMPTTANWGGHTYMLRDAHSGKLPHIPAQVMSIDIASPTVWECTRLVISDNLVTQRDRSECLRLIVDGLVETALAHGATELICLSSMALMRALRQLGYDATRLGEPYRNDEDGRQYAVLKMPAAYSALHASRRAAIDYAQLRRDVEFGQMPPANTPSNGRDSPLPAGGRIGPTDLRVARVG